MKRNSMHKSLLALGLLFTVPAVGHAQLLNSIKKAVTSATSGTSSLSTSEVGSALKEALTQGVQNGTTKLSAVDGFFKDAAIKILMPDEAKKVESTLRAVGLGSLVDNAILSMNRAAEDASKTAAPIFINAIKEMTISDAIGLLQGSDTAATHYLKQKTTTPLSVAFKPTIDTSLQKVNATKYWGDVITQYNKLSPFKKINPDLSAFVTQKAMDGIFYEVALEEQKIRKDPAARATDLLKKVFGSSTATK